MNVENNSEKIINNKLYARYDAACKAVLSYKAVLAQILKGCVEEYKNEDPKYIEELIEEDIKVSEEIVHRDDASAAKISGMNTEDASAAEGTVFYDILFQAYTPDKKDKVKLIINIEAQNSFDSGYPLVRRALYYCSRLISSQKGRQFFRQDYGDIKKVISIWICSNPPKRNINTLTRFSVAKSDLIGEARYNFKDYDVLEVIMVCLDFEAIKSGDFKTEDENFKEVIKFLTYLLTSGLNNAEKKEIFKTEYNISLTDKIDLEVANMCNLGYGFYDAGRTEGKAANATESVKMLMKNLGLSLSEALNALGITKEEYNDYIALVGAGNA